MPIYEYLCQKCGHDFEKIMPMDAPPPGECPECQEAGSVGKKVSRSSVKFVGQGWYVTDYASKKPIESPASTDTKSSGTLAATKSSIFAAVSLSGLALCCPHKMTLACWIAPRLPLDVTKPNASRSLCWAAVVYVSYRSVIYYKCIYVYIYICVLILIICVHTLEAYNESSLRQEAETLGS